MRQAAFLPVVALAILSAGCVLHGKQQKVSTTPAPPTKPTSATPAPTPAPQGPLSIPQTVAELPAPQPIPPEAVAVVKPSEEQAESQPAARTPPRRTPAGPPKAPEPAPVAAQPAPTPPPEQQPERPAIQEILPPAESKRLQDSADSKKRDIKKVLDQTDMRKLNNAQRDLVARIRTLVQQSDDAEGHNEMRAADNLATQAQVLIRELQGVR